MKLTLEQARGLWFHGQSLDGQGGDALRTLAATGPIRTLGGADVYISARARVAGLTRVELDEMSARQDVQVIPAARGCMYLVARPDVPTYLSFAAEGFRKRNQREMEKVGCDAAEFAAVRDAAVAALQAGPMTPAQLRAALPDGVVRPFGAAGKKIGLSSALPSALRDLEFDGVAERGHEGGRLDSERYLWQLTGGAAVSAEPDAAEVLATLARRFFTFAGPATRDEFSAWSGAGKRACQAAIDAIGLAPVQIEGYPCVAFAHAEATRPVGPASDAVRFLSYEDTYVTVHGGPGVLTDPAYHDVEVPVWGAGGPQTLGSVKHMHLRPFFIGPRLRGLWEFDPDTAEVFWTGLGPLTTSEHAQVAEEADLLGTFLRDEVGHGLSFSLDTPDAARQRIQTLASL